MIYINPAFAQWFTGFFDGEGHFYVASFQSKPVTKFTRGWTTQAAIQIAQRFDDRAAVEYIAENLGGCKVYEVKQRGAKPKCMFRMANTDQLIEYIFPIFDRYPLHTKKAKEYPLWREAVLIANQRKKNRKAWAQHVESISDEDYARFMEIKEALHQIRRC